MRNNRYTLLAETRQSRCYSSVLNNIRREYSFSDGNQIHDYDLGEQAFDLNMLINQSIEGISDIHDERDYLLWLVGLMMQSPMAYNLLRDVNRLGWRISLLSLENNGFHLDIENKIIFLDNYDLSPRQLAQSSYYHRSLVLVLVRALRDVCHEKSFVDSFASLKPAAFLQLERIRAADIDTIAIYVGWELRTAGNEELWRHILASDDGDMAQVLANIMHRYPSANYDGMALAHVFRQWFVDEDRVDTVDYYTLEYIDLYSDQDKTTLKGKNLSLYHIEMATFLFDGKTYLKDLELVVLTDPFFTALSDPINQARLFQIMYDSKVTFIHDIPFRDPVLAEKFL